MANLNLNFNAITKLKDWWDVVKSNFSAVNNQVEGHVAGNSDKHNAQDINYSGAILGANNVKVGLDSLHNRVEEIITTPAEGISAQEIIDSRKGNTSLGTKIDAIDAELAETMTTINVVKQFGAKGNANYLYPTDGLYYTDSSRDTLSNNDTQSIRDALLTKKNVYVPEGFYLLNETLVLSPFQTLTLDKRAILKFTNNNLNSCINMSMSSCIDGGIIEVSDDFKNTVVLFDTSINQENFTETYPFTYGTNNVMSRHGLSLKNIIIQKNKACPLNTSKIGGVAIKFNSRNDVTVNYNFVWGALLENIKINGAFDIGIYLLREGTTWIHDTFIKNIVMEYPKIGFYFDRIKNVHISDGAYQPQPTSDNIKYAEHGIVMNSCANIKIDDYSFWDFQHAIDINAKQVYKLIGQCDNIEIHDFADTNRLIYDTFDTALTLKYFTSRGQRVFDEVLYYRDFQSQPTASKATVISEVDAIAYYDYSVPMKPMALFGATPSAPKYVQLGYFNLSINENDEVNRLTIQDATSEGIMGYSMLKIKTDANGIPTLSRKTQFLNNVDLNNQCDYAYSYTIANGITKLIIYKKYTGQWQDVYQFYRSLKIIYAYKFITRIVVNAIPVNPIAVPRILTNPNPINRPQNAPVGYSYFNNSLEKPIWCKTASTFDVDGNVLTPGVWVDALGTIV